MMGFYVNPPGNKFDWLTQNGKTLTLQEAQGFLPVHSPDEALVVWVDNGPFDAAGVAYSRTEQARFLAPDVRPRQYFLVPVSKLNADVGLDGFAEIYAKSHQEP